MSDQTNAQVSRSLPANATEPAGALRTSAGAALRIDSAHAEQPPVDGSSPVPLAPDVAGGRQDDQPGDERYTLQTAQIAAHLQTQYAETDRREQRLNAQLAQFDQERREARLWAAELETSLHEREYAITRQEAALAQRADACIKLEADLKELHETLLRERHALNAEREQFVIDRDEDRRLLDDLRLQQEREIGLKNQDFLAEHERLRLELRQERTLLDNRHHFQQEHLRRTMQEFEVTQAEFRRERQIAMSRAEQFDRQNLLRSRQLDRLRELVEERQRSLDRERDVLTKERRAIGDRHQADRESLARERATWEQDREVQRADLRRQQDLLAVHADNLETRRQRLDRLRIELEETNRQTLELRLAIEETYAQLTQTAGAEQTKKRVEEARTILAEYYRHTRDALLQQRQELEQAQSNTIRQRDEFLKERQVLVDWVAGQEEQLARREQEVLQTKSTLDARETTWRRAADGWTGEKLQAEAVIRDLLKQLAEREAGASR